FFSYAEQFGIELAWGTRRDSAEAINRKLSAPIPGAPKACAVVDYRVGKYRGRLFSGFFYRPFRDLLRSSDLIEFLKAGGSQAAKEDDLARANENPLSDASID